VIVVVVEEVEKEEVVALEVEDDEVVKGRTV
jgi:hypothetical protein